MLPCTSWFWLWSNSRSTEIFLPKRLMVLLVWPETGSAMKRVSRSFCVHPGLHAHGQGSCQCAQTLYPGGTCSQPGEELVWGNVGARLCHVLGGCSTQHRPCALDSGHSSWSWRLTWEGQVDRAAPPEASPWLVDAVLSHILTRPSLCASVPPPP